MKRAIDEMGVDQVIVNHLDRLDHRECPMARVGFNPPSQRLAHATYSVYLCRVKGNINILNEEDYYMY